MCLKHEGVALYDSGKLEKDRHLQVYLSINIDPMVVVSFGIERTVENQSKIDVKNRIAESDEGEQWRSWSCFSKKYRWSKENPHHNKKCEEVNGGS